MLVFIYGTLMKGGPNHSILVGVSSWTKKAKFIGDMWIDGAVLYDLGGAPALKLLADDEYDIHTKKVHGELWDVPDEHVTTRLDRLEGHPVLYKRTHIGKHLDKPVYTYVFAKPLTTSNKIESGRWNNERFYHEQS